MDPPMLPAHGERPGDFKQIQYPHYLHEERQAFFQGSMFLFKTRLDAYTIPIMLSFFSILNQASSIRMLLFLE